jgi:hypothetical protein
MKNRFYLRALEADRAAAERKIFLGSGIISLMVSLKLRMPKIRDKRI